MTALDGHAPPDSRNADSGAHEPNDAAGPLTGELPTETVADADISPDATQAAAAAAIAVAIVAAVPVAAPVVALVATAPPATPSDGGSPATPAAPAGAAQAAPPQPLPGLVPARVDANGAVVPVLPTTTATTAGSQAATPTAQGTTPTAQATTPAPAATITLTLTSMDAGKVPVTPATPAPAAAPAAPGATTAPGAAAVTAAATAPTISTSVTPQAGSGQDAPPAAASREPAPAPAAAATPTAPAPSPAFGQAAPAPIQPPAPGGIAHGAGGLTTPHELAHELGTRVHMAVREGGRELLVNLRPKDLGQLTIRVTMTDGVLHARITADRPEAARMLQQSLGQLDTALTDLGYSLDGLDVSYGGQDARDARSSSAGTDAPARAAANDEPEAVKAVPATHATASASRLDLLA